MKITLPICIALCVAPLAFAQSPSPAATGHTDLYHVHFANAATGKAQALADELKKTDKTLPMPDHVVVLRHEDGDSWDYCVITHMGTKMTVEANRPPTPASTTSLYAAHTDTLCSGPAWSEFSKQLGVDDASKSAGSAYVISIYRPAAGQREALDSFLNQPPDKTTDSSVGRVTLQHLEGAAWTFVSIQRWKSWADYGNDNIKSIAQMGRNQQGGWFKLRDLISFHTDTLCDRISP